ncbi:uncharacterized protein LOC115991336 [Quercus lobata]|uniref:uncharacterized protein LOC115991336 n=1 Tax=Quercus lobata TaxID=97700 RepID=UPI001243A912|nr:uncharacterized protein LOC115991336 [Quercus lobata]
MKKGVDMFMEGSKWIASKNGNLSFWFNKWLSRGTMRNLIEGPLNQGEDQLLLKDIVGFNGWNWHALSFIFKQLALEIKATPLPFSSTCEDRISWISSTNGDFDIKEAYKIACTEKSVSDHNLFHGSWVWKVLLLPKVQCFLWQCYHQSILSHALLAVRGIDIDPLCPLYRNAVMFNDGRTRGSVRENTILQVMEFVFLGINEKHAASCNTIQVKWTKPPTNWYKENSDASSLGNLDLARGGGLIRDEMGKWIKGYARAIGLTTSVAAVLWAL